MEKTDLKEWIYHGLFERVPSNIAIIDRDFRIVDANRNFSEAFGEWKEKQCFEVFKDRQTSCSSCKAKLVFNDGKSRISEEHRLNRNGKHSYYVVHFEPIVSQSGNIPYLIEMSQDVTETRLLQQEYDIIFDRVPCYIAVIDRNMTIVRNNELFRKTFGESLGMKCYEIYRHENKICNNCPALKTFSDSQVHAANKIGQNKKGETIHYHVTTSPLSREEGEPSHVIEMALDFTEIQTLEQEKLEAERLAAVGQTVAGLAHGIKNVLMGLDGGMYVVNSGIQSDDKELTQRGWEMLQNNITRITAYVKDFLNFAKGRGKPHVESVDPNRIAEEVVELYKDSAEQNGVTLTTELQKDLEYANLDREGIHTCLTNLVSNAIDACDMSDKPNGKVVLRTFDRNDVLVYEVSDDGCGMDYDIKKKVFTSFFSTKGLSKGTGLGMLVTRKITQEHGGKVTLESTEGEGSVFRLEFPRHRLPKPAGGERENNTY